jgi:hypothetical protein
MTYLIVFRRVVVGACFIGAAIGLAQQIPWLLAVSVCVGIGEFIESSYYIGVMRWGQRRGLAPDIARVAYDARSEHQRDDAPDVFFTHPASQPPKLRSTSVSRRRSGNSRTSGIMPAPRPTV